MRRSFRFVPVFVLAAIILIAGIAATPAQLAPPSQPIVTATAGELLVSWNPVAGAQHYTVGYASPDEMDRMAAAGRNRLDAFTYTTIGAENISHTLSGLEPETVYWVTVGAHTERFGATDLVWARQHAIATTAGEHGDGFCPITGLPLGDEGYLEVGDIVEGPLASFRLTAAAAPEQITLPYASDPNQLFSPRAGRRFVQVCGDYQHTFSSSRLDEGDETIMDSDAGPGFNRVNTHERIDGGVTGYGCEIWDVPASAQTAVYAVGLAAYNSRDGVTGTYEDGIGLYRIDLNTASSTLIPLQTQTGTQPLTPLTSQQLTDLVKPALGQVCNETGCGTGFVVRSDGLMVTNRHVVDGANTVTVYMQSLDGQLFTHTGTVLGRGILADLAVVRLPAGTYDTLPLADSDDVSGADEVTAWGYPGGSISGTYPTITRGIISSKGIRGDVDFLQTDAAINPGNSGGPLIDQYGRVVGVNTLKTVSERIDNQGFAITSNEVSNRLNTLINGGLDSETYRNVKYRYGYSLDIPKGWYLDREGGRRTTFYPYHDENWSRIRTYDFSSSEALASTEASIVLDALADVRWNESLPENASKEEWTLFEPVSLREIGSGSARHYRLEYRRQSDADSCIENKVEIIVTSPSYSTNSLAFSMMGSVCEGAASSYFTERDAILDDFRP